MSKKTAVVICPGRGVYNVAELGYLQRHHADKSDLFAGFDAQRVSLGQETLAALDGAASYAVARHTRGDNASALIFAATLADFMVIDAEIYDIVAITGNSMGWYSALTCGGALSPDAGFNVANSMGMLMQQSLIGEQLIYPFVDEDWVPNAERKQELMKLVYGIDALEGSTLQLSICLGGMLVLAGNHVGLKAFCSCVPPLQGRYPLWLTNHAAFHTFLQEPVAAQGRAALPSNLFQQPRIPLIDGRGAIWWPHSTDTQALWDYTLGEQVTRTYDFTRAVQIAAREFAPDVFIITGPGSTLGGAVAQSLILDNWRGLVDKADFQARQTSGMPVLRAMGLADQRN